MFATLALYANLCYSVLVKLTPTNLANALDKARVAKPWALKVAEHCATEHSPAWIEYRITPRRWPLSVDLDRAIYFVRIEMRRDGLWAECRDRSGELCQAMQFGRVCYHVGQTVRRLESL